MKISRRRLFGLMGATALTPALPGAVATMTTQTSGAIIGQGALATASVAYSTSAPAALKVGALWQSTETFVLKRWDGRQWLDIRPV